MSGVEQIGLPVDDGSEAYWAKQERLRAHSADFTPSPLVGQIVVKTYARFGPRPPRRVLDFHAGAGVFSRWLVFVGEEHWPSRRPHVTAVECRAEERPWLARNADAHVIADWRELLEHPTAGGLYDLIIGNPNFDTIHEALPVVIEELLAPGGYVVWLGHNGLGQRGEAGWGLFDRYPPAEQWRIRGPIRFRVGINPKTNKPYQSDVRDYSVWVWHKGPRMSLGVEAGAATAGWYTADLPQLPSHQLRWEIEPGTDDPPPCLPVTRWGGGR